MIIAATNLAMAIIWGDYKWSTNQFAGQPDVLKQYDILIWWDDIFLIHSLWLSHVNYVIALNIMHLKASSHQII